MLSSETQKKSPNGTVKVMLVDDSVLIRKYVSQILCSLDNIEVVATAPNGKIGLQKLFLYKPDVIILDIEMPEMSGLEFLKYLKENNPKAMPYVIMFSSLVDDGSAATFEALASGAVDFIKKPEGQVSDNLDFLKKEFDLKIKALYSNKKDRENLETGKGREVPENIAAAIVSTAPFRTGIENMKKILSEKPLTPEIVAIGSSTGGPVAIRKIFETLEVLPVPLVIAQHMPPGFTGEFAKNLAHIFNRQFQELSDGEVLKNGIVYICPGGSHARIVKVDGKLTYKMDSNNYEGFFFKPSVDIFFRSVKEASGKNVLAVVLTGMGRDGSTESVPLRKDGALVIAQDQESSVVWGMPGNTVKNGGADIVLPVNDIGGAINMVFRKA